MISFICMIIYILILYGLIILCAKLATERKEFYDLYDNSCQRREELVMENKALREANTEYIAQVKELQQFKGKYLDATNCLERVRDQVECFFPTQNYKVGDIVKNSTGQVIGVINGSGPYSSPGKN